ncbi:Olfactory receptor, insect [Cinara cedri]|uniref:Olfactory receptor, insect n=1 Tax=Cinara cedri TaxID=506608 RepID=A0A5E4NFS0_9HEMI|nr:Olfactory receptor, insect [Cinara cedri]
MMINASPPSESLSLAVNLTLFKRLGFYYLFNPNGNTICDVNVGRVSGMMFTLVAQIIIVFGALGLFSVGEDDAIDHTVRVQLLFSYLIDAQCLVKTATFVCKVNGIWLMLGVARSDFLAGTQCRRHVTVLCWYRSRSVTITNVLIGFAMAAAVEWALYPVASNSLSAEDTGQWRRQKRFENIINFRFPVSVHTYNERYLLFYAAELWVTVFLVYVYMIFDVFFISFCCDILARYEMIARAFENVGFNKTVLLDSDDQGNNKNDPTNDENYEDFKSILNDQQKLYLYKLRILGRADPGQDKKEGNLENTYKAKNKDVNEAQSILGLRVY